LDNLIDCEYGRLLIGVNDDTYRDNTGSYRATIRW
jgi:hypothetical protein